MFGDALVTGIVIMLSLLAVAGVVVALLVWRSRSNDSVKPGTVPPPVDPGAAEPEQARDVNADEPPGDGPRG
ncbi:MAG: hypothetical protein WBL06_06700 [Pseudolysinimonas sp.]|jgi:hypothetical protein|uniref:hypothetical protein n=1 Tax=Pseudolysinimonas sp. TaxID=2680009 RepID=UPI003C795CAC